MRAPARTAEVMASWSLKANPNSMMPMMTSRKIGVMIAASTAATPRSQAR